MHKIVIVSAVCIRNAANRHLVGFGWLGGRGIGFAMDQRGRGFDSWPASSLSSKCRASCLHQSIVASVDARQRLDYWTFTLWFESHRKLFASQLEQVANLLCAPRYH